MGIFTSDGVTVGIRSVERYDLVKIKKRSRLEKRKNKPITLLNGYLEVLRTSIVMMMMMIKGGQLAVLVFSGALTNNNVKLKR